MDQQLQPGHAGRRLARSLRHATRDGGSCGGSAVCVRQLARDEPHDQAAGHVQAATSHPRQHGGLRGKI